MPAEVKTQGDASPGSAVVVKHPTGASVVTRIAKAGVYLVFTLVSMVTRCAITAVLLEPDEVAGASILTRIRETDVAFGEDLRICFV